MGQFSVTIYGATGSALSDIQHTKEYIGTEQAEALEIARKYHL